MRSVELFAGCGGLALGLARAGFRHELVIENDPYAFATLWLNKARRVEHVADWNLCDSDVAHVDYDPLKNRSGEIDLVSGGPPCQPFSIGGRHLGHEDERNMWPQATRAVREVLPRAFLFENVKGLLRCAFKDYLDYILLEFQWPELAPKTGEAWQDHRNRLLAYAKLNKGRETYRVVVKDINAADYGSAQKRMRVFVMGVRSDVSNGWEFPSPTHSMTALAIAKETGAYWAKHDIPERLRPELSREEKSAIAKVKRRGGLLLPELAWVTVRDKLAGLPEPSSHRGDWNHNQHPGARSYAPGHTGSNLDEPSKALKAGSHGVPGGENILALPDGGVRYFTVREMARLQGLPDDYLITGTWRRVIPQLGNALPAEVGEVLGRSLSEILNPPHPIQVSAPVRTPAKAA